MNSKNQKYYKMNSRDKKIQVQFSRSNATYILWFLSILPTKYPQLFGQLKLFFKEVVSNNF